MPVIFHVIYDAGMLACFTPTVSWECTDKVVTRINFRSEQQVHFVILNAVNRMLIYYICHNWSFWVLNPKLLYVSP